MEFSVFFSWLGFLLATYAVVGNDSIQTLGTFLASNKKRPWYILWFFAASILSFVVFFSWYSNTGDVTYGRLDRIPVDVIEWWHVLPVLALLFLTRFGFPVSTSLMVLSIFASQLVLSKIILKSVLGYGIALLSSFFLWFLVARFEKWWTADRKVHPAWYVFQWFSTGFLWSQWLVHDFANIYVFLPNPLSFSEVFISWTLLITMLAVIMYLKGGEIQKIVTSKYNSFDVRSATIIDLFYGLIMFVFKEWNNLPMSTTWLFLGVLAGREIILRSRVQAPNQAFSKTIRPLAMDLAKASFGLVISVGLALLIKNLLS